MATGDPVIVTGSVGGGSTVTVSIPTGELWQIYGYSSSWQCHLESNNGSGNSGYTKVRGGAQSNGHKDLLDQRPIYSDSINPRINNTNCSSNAYSIHALEVQ